MISPADYLNWLEGVGTGWLGWTYDTTLDTPMAAIHRAYEARCEMLRSIFGGAKSSPETSNRKMTPQLFDAIFKGK